MRAKNGSVPRTFDPGFKSSYQKMRDRLQELERRDKQFCKDFSALVDAVRNDEGDGPRIEIPGGTLADLSGLFMDYVHSLERFHADSVEFYEGVRGVWPSDNIKNLSGLVVSARIGLRGDK